jgi:hypothetical protein
MTTTNHGHAVALDAVREALAAQLRLTKTRSAKRSGWTCCRTPIRSG